MISREGWKLSIYGQGPNELFDMDTDPHEFENLFDKREQGERISDFMNRLRQWQTATGDDFPLPSE